MAKEECGKVCEARRSEKTGRGERVMAENQSTKQYSKTRWRETKSAKRKMRRGSDDEDDKGPSMKRPRAMRAR